MSKEAENTNVMSLEEAKAQKSTNLLEALLNEEDVVQVEVPMKRFGTFIVKSITSDDYAQIEKRCKYPVKNRKTGEVKQEIDTKKLNAYLVAVASVQPDWSDARLLAKYNTQDPADVVQKRLLMGEMTQLASAIMDASGFNDDVEEVKN